jgi:hypothetical protein
LENWSSSLGEKFNNSVSKCHDLIWTRIQNTPFCSTRLHRCSTFTSPSSNLYIPFWLTTWTINIDPYRIYHAHMLTETTGFGS